MSFFKNKSKEIIVTQNSVRVVMTPEELLAQEYEEGVEDILNQTIIVSNRIDLKDLVKTDVKLVDVDNENDGQRALIAEAVELFSKILKGYPVNDKVKVWVEKASKGE